MSYVEGDNQDNSPQAWKAVWEYAARQGRADEYGSQQCDRAFFQWSVDGRPAPILLWLAVWLDQDNGPTT